LRQGRPAGCRRYHCRITQEHSQEWLCHLKAAATKSSGFARGLLSGWLDEFGAGGFRLVGLDVGFDFGAEAHAAIAVRIRLCVHNPGLAVGFVGLPAGDFGGHADGRFDGHAYLERGRGDEEKSATRDVQSFGEVFALIACKINGAEAQGDAQTVALEMSAFRRSHVAFRALRGGAHTCKGI